MFFDHDNQQLFGEKGTLPLMDDDEIARKFVMLIEGECEGLGPTKAAQKHGLSKQRYFQLRDTFQQFGAAALQNKTRGPKRNYRRTDEMVRQVICHRFLAPDAFMEAIAQKVRQTGFVISNRSVQRVIAEFGLKKTLSMSSSP